MIPGLPCDEAINDRKVLGSFSPLKRQGQFSVLYFPGTTCLARRQVAERSCRGRGLVLPNRGA